MIVLETWEPDLQVASQVKPSALRTWTAREGLEAVCSREADRLVVESSGSAGCFGGWDVVFEGIEAGKYYRIGIGWEAEGLDSVLDGMPIFVLWTDDQDERVDYDYLMVRSPEGAGGRAERVLVAPEGATRAVLRCGLRWTTTGRAIFFCPAVDPAEPPEPRIVRIAVATAKPAGSESVEDNVAFWCDMVREAADCRPDLVLMPECITSWTLPRDRMQHARPIPGPESDAFCQVAAECDTMVALSMNERDGELIHNTGLIIERDGTLVGKYRKVHLAILEGWDGVTPGDEQPVFHTSLGALTMTICKDSSIHESARVPAVKGAEAMLLSIMGDHRAVDWRQRPSWFSPDRWKVIMRARAIDNHLWMIVARNNQEGSCVISPGGDILAYNDGGQRVIWADCDFGERLRPWRGSSFADATWAERRPQLYGAIGG
jgi:predicted amidohydrolase